MDRTINLLEWYPFEENAKVLEIYNENSILQNLKIKIELEQIEIKKFNIEGKYDYITLIGTYEYAPILMEGEKPYSDFLKMLRNHLNPNGKILLAIDNRLGIKYFVGAKSEHYEAVFEGLENEIRNKKTNLLVKKELEKFINEAEFEHYKFYYPLSDFKNVSTIFTDEFMPKSNNSKIIYPINYENSQIDFDEIKAYKEIIKNNMFDFFANSFLVEASQEPIETNVDLKNIELIEISNKSKRFYEKEYPKKEDLQTLKEENRKIRNELEAIKGSRSWKIMKPIRIIKNKFKRGI